MSLAAPAIILTGIVTLLAVLISLAFAIGVARARREARIDAPAMTGHPVLERAVRIQGNTVEQFVIFLPSLWLAALYFQGWLPPIIGAVWCLGRIIYAFTYGDRKSRFPGFALTIFPTLILIVLAAIGLFGAWTASSV
jgi:glutathione S-transferase